MLQALHVRFHGLDGGFLCRVVRLRVVGILFGHGIRLQQTDVAIGRDLCQIEVRFGGAQIGAGLAELLVNFGGFDFRKQLSRRDARTDIGIPLS